ncbi:MAG: hypothetical protein WCO43_05085 [Chitinophagia bacterium]|jgi:hypothetical protein
MKRFFALLLSLSFIAASSGASVNIHYCRGKVSSVSWSILPTASCKCGKKTMKGCCKTETRLVKLSDNAKQPEFTAAHSMPVVEAPTVTTFFVPQPLALELTATAFSASPPGSERISVFLRNRVFRL